LLGLAILGGVAISRNMNPHAQSVSERNGIVNAENKSTTEAVDEKAEDKAITETVDKFFSSLKNNQLEEVYGRLSPHFQGLFGNDVQIQKDYLKVYMPKKEHPELRIEVTKILKDRNDAMASCLVYSGSKVVADERISMVKENGEWKIADFGKRGFRDWVSKGLFLTLVAESGT